MVGLLIELQDIPSFVLTKNLIFHSYTNFYIYVGV